MSITVGFTLMPLKLGEDRRSILKILGNNKPVELLYFIEQLEKAIGKKAIKNLLPMQPGDVPETYADLTETIADIGFKPTISIELGIPRFVNWYRSYYKI